MESSIYLVIALSCVITFGMIALMVYVMRQWTKNRRNETISEDELLALPHYRCPKCGVSMKPGLAMAARGMMWHPVERGRSGWNPADAVSNTMNTGFIAYANRAWECESCHFLLIDHSAMVRVKKNKEG